MTSYFDHFIITKLFFCYITDSLFIIAFVVFLWLILAKNFYLIPSGFQLVLEYILNHWFLVIKENLGEKSVYYLLPICSLFMIILGMNLLGFFVYTLPPTTHITLTFGMAFSVWLSVIFLGLYKFKISFFSIFMPLGAPLFLSPFLVFIEVISNVSRPIALGMRLAANLTAGHILLAILADFSCKMLFFSYKIFNLFPILIVVFMTVLEVGVLVIQAYVFCLLSLIYLKDSLILH